MEPDAPSPHLAFRFPETGGFLFYYRLGSTARRADSGHRDVAARHMTRERDPESGPAPSRMLSEVCIHISDMLTRACAGMRRCSISCEDCRSRSRDQPVANSVPNTQPLPRRSSKFRHGNELPVPLERIIRAPCRRSRESHHLTPALSRRWRRSASSNPGQIIFTKAPAE